MIRGTLIALFALFAIPTAGRGQGTIPKNGTELFRFALHQKGLKPLSRVDEALIDPNGTMIVIVGNTSHLPAVIRSSALRHYVTQGGAVLIASDSTNIGLVSIGGRLEPGWGAVFGITIKGQKLRAPPINCYAGELDGRPFRPFVRPLPAPVDRQRPSLYDLLDDVPELGNDAIATDRPSGIEAIQPPLRFIQTGVAAYARGIHQAGNGTPVEHWNFGVSMRYTDGFGRFLAFADDGVFANGMMGFKRKDDEDKGYILDNGNWQFANRTIDWLKGGFEPGRSHCLFIQDETIINEFAIQIPQSPKPPIPNLPPEVMANLVLNYMNPLIDEAQERNFFNQMLEDSVGFSRLVRWFLIVVTVVFVFSCLRRLSQSRRRAEATATMTPNAQAALVPRGGVLRQRTAAQIEVGNLFEAAARRVRDRFDIVGGRPGADGAMPPILIAGDVRDAPVLKRTVEWLWELGYGNRPIAVAPTEWDQMNSLLERSMSRAARGHWSFGQTVG